jgi:hypothetical protein
MPTPGFEPAIPASERPQTIALDRSATGMDKHSFYLCKFIIMSHNDIWHSFQFLCNFCIKFKIFCEVLTFCKAVQYKDFAVNSFYSSDSEITYITLQAGVLSAWDPLNFRTYYVSRNAYFHVRHRTSPLNIRLCPPQIKKNLFRKPAAFVALNTGAPGVMVVRTWYSCIRLKMLCKSSIRNSVP